MTTQWQDSTPNSKAKIFMSATTEKLQQEQSEYWNGQGGETWLEQFDVIDQFLVPFQTAVLNAAAIKDGEYAVDIGCGTGGTALPLAQGAGATGQVLGVDISEPLIAEARKRADRAGVTNVDFEVGDAGAFAFEPGKADLLFSRFGVMFFGDPYGAFKNIRKGIKPGGRVAFACWQEIQKNPFFLVPMGAAFEVLPPPEPLPPGTPGPFAFGDKDYLLDILKTAGFENIEIEGMRATMAVPDDFSAERAAEFFVTFGPTKRLLEDQPSDIVEKVRAKIVAALEEHVVGQKVKLEGAIWLVRATA